MRPLGVKLGLAGWRLNVVFEILRDGVEHDQRRLRAGEAVFAAEGEQLFGVVVSARRKLCDAFRGPCASDGAAIPRIGFGESDRLGHVAVAEVEPDGGGIGCEAAKHDHAPGGDLADALHEIHAVALDAGEEA